MSISDDNSNCVGTAFLVFCQDFNRAIHTIKNQMYKIHKAINVRSKNWSSERSQNIIINETSVIINGKSMSNRSTCIEVQPICI